MSTSHKSSTSHTSNNASSVADNIISPANTPLVKPEDVSAGKPSDNADKALNNVIVSESLKEAVSKHAQSEQSRLLHQSECALAIANYYKALDETSADATAGFKAKEKLEAATADISSAFADAILAKAYDRKEVRRKLGEAFGFVESPKTGKPTSKPNEPGNTIAKRVSSVTIAAEYATTGMLPDKGGDSLPLLGRDKVEEILSDFFDRSITVRAASERLEQALRDVKETIPLELSADRLTAFAGKIQTASEAIAKDPALREAYATIFTVIASIPFE